MSKEIYILRRNIRSAKEDCKIGRNLLVSMIFQVFVICGDYWIKAHWCVDRKCRPCDVEHVSQFITQIAIGFACVKINIGVPLLHWLLE